MPWQHNDVSRFTIHKIILLNNAIAVLMVFIENVRNNMGYVTGIEAIIFI